MPALSTVCLYVCHTIYIELIVFIAPDDVRIDNLSEGVTPDSAVWPKYLNTATVHDAEMIDGWNKSLDVLLIFVSHFSTFADSFDFDFTR
jgi:hypothetical protein